MGELTPRATDALSAFGERLSSLIVTAHFQDSEINAAHVDAREVIVTDGRHTQAAPLFPETNARLMAVIPQSAQTHVPVMGGFIASTVNGVTTTLGRGGSDYTASIVGAGIGAEEIQSGPTWTACSPPIRGFFPEVIASRFAPSPKTFFIPGRLFLSHATLASYHRQARQASGVWTHLTPICPQLRQFTASFAENRSTGSKKCRKRRPTRRFAAAGVHIPVHSRGALADGEVFSQPPFSP